MAKSKKKKTATAKSGMTPANVPCLRVVVGGKPGATGQTANSCAIVGESRGGVEKFNLGKKYGSTSRTVATPKKNKPCLGTKNRKGCPVQLAFEDGQPFLRFCTTEKQAGYRVNVNSPAEATAQANAACATWQATGKFDFPAGTPLRGDSPKRRK